ncbi:hypothetical protein Ahy_B08g089932 [Arachis hypogaea]|uniref:Uncharacterized protein n=1 Tax=Arachis hypogaea TaxID=3818 RepID=A0A444XZ74_ARAHY|nr:hypothetical protein Ahy_B08g089932 [Arachis hypogaea]
MSLQVTPTICRTGNHKIHQPELETCRSKYSRGRVSSGTRRNSGSSLSILTTPVTSHVAGLSDQPFIMVPNPNYVPPSTVTTLPPSAQQPNATATPPLATDTVAWNLLTEVSLLMPLHHLLSCTLYGTLYTMPSSERYTTIEWIGSCSRCWRMFVRGGTTSQPGSPRKSRRPYHWETDDRFIYRRLTNRANRASARSSKYTSGSATFMKTKVRLSYSSTYHY